jgi:hypothetical protein
VFSIQTLWRSDKAWEAADASLKASMQFPAQDDRPSAWGSGGLSGSGKGVGDGPGYGSWGVLI